jgi:hypothetical protein
MRKTKMISLVLMIVSLICFLLGAANIPATARVNLVSLGLAFWVLAIVIGGAGVHPALGR